MAAPLRHDFYRTLRSKSVIGSVVVMIGLSMALIPLLSISTSGSVFGSGGQTVLFYESGSRAHLLAYSYNVYGEPVQGTSFSLKLSSSSGAASGGATTNSSGLAAWTMEAPPSPNGFNYTLSVNGGSSVVALGVLPAADGTVQSLAGNPVAIVTDPSNSSRVDAVFVYEGPNGTLPTGYGVYYGFSSGFVAGPPSRGEMASLGTSAGYVSAFKLPPAPSGDDTVTVAAFKPDGALLGSSSETTSAPVVAALSPNALFTAFISSIFSLVVPLMAVLVSYNSYGKDRASGVLDSVLTRPVSRVGLGGSRYLSIVFAIALAVALATGVMAVISQAMLGSTISLWFAAYTVAGLAVEGAAFVGLIMLISRVVMAAGGGIGAGVVRWVVLDFAWGIIVLLASYAMGVQIGSGDYLSLSIRSAFFNPAQFYSLVGEFLNGVSLVSGSGSTPISAATYGLTPLTLAAAGAFWVLAPLAGFLYLATRRD